MPLRLTNPFASRVNHEVIAPPPTRTAVERPAPTGNTPRTQGHARQRTAQLPHGAQVGTPARLSTDEQVEAAGSTARTAQSELAECMHRQETGAARTRVTHDALHGLDQHTAGAVAEAVAALATRQSEVQSARQAEGVARQALDQSERDRQQPTRLHEQASQRLPGLQQAAVDARAALQAGQAAERQARGAVPVLPWSAPATRATAQQALQRARTDLAPLQDRVTTADAALATHQQQVNLLAQARHDADQDHARLGQAHQHAVDHRRQAEANLTSLQEAMTARTDTFRTHRPLVAAHLAEGGRIAGLEAQAVADHRSLVQLSERAATSALTASSDRANVTAQRETLERLKRDTEAQQRLLAPGGQLRLAVENAQRRLDACSREVRDIEGSPPDRQGGLNAARAAERTAQQQHAAALSAQSQQQHAADLAATNQGLAATKLVHLQDVATQSTAMADGHDQARAAQDAVARAADTAASEARHLHQGEARQVATAIQQMASAVERVCQDLRPAPLVLEPVERSKWKKPWDGLVRAGRGLHARAEPVKIDKLVGPFGGVSSGSGATGLKPASAAPGKVSDHVASGRAQQSMDSKLNHAGKVAGGLLAQGTSSKRDPAPAAEAFRSAAAFSNEVARLFRADTPLAGPAVGAHQLLARHLLDHPNPDPVGRPPGHPLRHEEGLLIASALRSVTSDPNEAVQVYNTLWQEPPPALAGLTRRRVGASPLATHPASAQTPAGTRVEELAHTLRRALATSPGGMAALLNLQGLELPPAGHMARATADRAVENYQLMLRAETALLAQGINAGGLQSSEAVRQAVLAQPPALRDPSRLGTGNTRNGRNGPYDAEHPATLACQAFLHAQASLSGVPSGDVAAMKPAYVALRNGFTVSGQGSDFHKMAKRLQKFITYIDRTCNPPTSMGGRMKQGLRRAAGKDKTPLKTLLQAGPLGSNLGTVQGEHAKRLGGALGKASTLLQNDFTNRAQQMAPAEATLALTRLATINLWAAQAAKSPDLAQGVALKAEDIRAAASALHRQMGGPPLDAHTLDAQVAANSRGPLFADHLHGWIKEGRFADTQARPRGEVLALDDSLKELRGKATFDDGMDAIQARFDAGTVAERREILRELLISVVAGGDVTDYSDGRRNAVSGLFGTAVTPGVTAFGSAVGEFSAEHARTAVLKAGVASNTGVVFLGNEVKVGGSLGGGARGGFELGPVFNVTGTALFRLGASHLMTKGLMVRTNKQGVEHETLTPDQTQGLKSENWKRMSERVVNTVFQLAEPPASGARPANGGEMWAKVVEALGDHRDISFGWNEGNSTAANWSVSAEAIASANAGPVRFNAGAGAGLKQIFSRGKAQESAGAMQTVQANKGNRTSLNTGASVGFAHPRIQNEGDPNVAVFSRHKVGVETELLINSSNGLVRITTEGGRVKPGISYKHREYGVESKFTALVQAERSTWAPRLGERGPDGRLRGGQEAIDTFLQRVADLPKGGNRTFIERKCLTQDAADTLNAFIERLSVLTRENTTHAAPDGGAAEQVAALRQQIAVCVADEGSWQPFRLFVNESNSSISERGPTGDVRATPAKPEEGDNSRSGFDETFTGGGKLQIAARINVAHGGRDLITLDAQPVAGPPPLVQAAQEGRGIAAAELIQAGAPVDARDTSGRSALMEAAASGDASLVKSLLDAHAEPDLADHRGRTALMDAAQRGQQAVVDTLLDHGCDVNHQDAAGRTALMKAAIRGDADVVQALLPHARIDLTDNAGRTAHQEASERGHAAVAALLTPRP